MTRMHVIAITSEDLTVSASDSERSRAAMLLAARSCSPRPTRSRRGRAGPRNAAPSASERGRHWPRAGPARAEPVASDVGRGRAVLDMGLRGDKNRGRAKAEGRAHSAAFLVCAVRQVIGHVVIQKAGMHCTS